MIGLAVLTGVILTVVNSLLWAGHRDFHAEHAPEGYERGQKCDTGPGYISLHRCIMTCRKEKKT